MRWSSGEMEQWNLAYSLDQSGATLAGPEEHVSIPFCRVITGSGDGHDKRAGGSSLPLTSTGPAIWVCQIGCVLNGVGLVPDTRKLDHYARFASVKYWIGLVHDLEPDCAYSYRPN